MRSSGSPASALGRSPVVAVAALAVGGGVASSPAHLTVAAIVRVQVPCGAGEMTNVPEVACGMKEVESVGLNSTETEEAEEGERGARESSKVSGSVDTWSTDRVKDAVAA